MNAILNLETFCRYSVHIRTEIILETEGSIRKIQQRALFQYKTVKKGTPNLTFPYDHSLFTIVLVKQIFEKNKSWRAVSRSQTQF